MTDSARIPTAPPALRPALSVAFVLLPDFTLSTFSAFVDRGGRLAARPLAALPSTTGSATHHISSACSATTTGSHRPRHARRPNPNPRRPCTEPSAELP